MKHHFQNTPTLSSSSNARTLETNHSRHRRPHFNEQNVSSNQQAKGTSESIMDTNSSSYTAMPLMSSSSARPSPPGSAIVQQLHVIENNHDMGHDAELDTDHSASVASGSWVAVCDDRSNAADYVTGTGAGFWRAPAREGALPSLEEDTFSRSSLHLSEPAATYNSQVIPVDYNTAATVAATLPDYPSAGDAAVRTARGVAHTAYTAQAHTQTARSLPVLATIPDGRSLTADNLDLNTPYYAAPGDVDGWVRMSMPSYLSPHPRAKASSHKHRKRHSATSSKKSRTSSHHTNRSIDLSVNDHPTASLYMSSIYGGDSVSGKSPSSTMATTVGSTRAPGPVGLNVGADEVVLVGGWVPEMGHDMYPAGPDMDFE